MKKPLPKNAQGTFVDACKFYREKTGGENSALTLSSLNRYYEDVEKYFHWHKAALLYEYPIECDNGKIDPAMIVGWYKAGCLQREFKEFVKYNRRMKKQESLKGIEDPGRLKNVLLSMYRMARESMENYPLDKKKDLARNISSGLIANIEDARQEFLNVILNDIVKEPRFHEFFKYGETVINYLFIWSNIVPDPETQGSNIDIAGFQKYLAKHPARGFWDGIKFDIEPPKKREKTKSQGKNFDERKKRAVSFLRESIKEKSKHA